MNVFLVFGVFSDEDDLLLFAVFDSLELAKAYGDNECKNRQNAYYMTIEEWQVNNERSLNTWGRYPNEEWKLIVWERMYDKK